MTKNAPGRNKVSKRNPMHHIEMSKKLTALGRRLDKRLQEMPGDKFYRLVDGKLVLVREID